MARFDDDGSNPPNAERGAVWVLFLNTDGTVRSYQKISDWFEGFNGILHNADLFGNSVAALGDLDRDGASDLAVGAINDDDGGENRGAVWVLFLDGVSCEPCDMNCDGLVDANDIEGFIDILFNGATPCGACTGDTNGDGFIDAGDIEGFIECLFP